jgi:hypothetical protein
MLISVGPCYRCKSEIALPQELHDAAKRSPRISFWCPYGHEQHFCEGETEEQKLRRERDRLQQRLAEKDDEIAWQRKSREETERKLTATRGVVTKIKNRVGHGVCPCCNRTFENLARHMNSKHRGYAAEPAEAAVIALRRSAE